PAWPSIAPMFQDVKLASTVAVDAEFSFRLNNFPIRARFAVVQPNAELTWTGTSLVHRHRSHYAYCPLGGDHPPRDGGILLGDFRHAVDEQQSPARATLPMAGGDQAGGGGGIVLARRVAVLV